MQRRCPYLLLLLTALLALVACTTASSTPIGMTVSEFVTVTDSDGVTVSLGSAPQRIISLGPSNTEILYALGVGDLIVGVDDYSDYPPEVMGKTKVGAPFPTFNLETIVALRPDLVLAVPLIDFNDQLRDLGIPVVVIESKSLSEIFDGILLIGNAVGAVAESTFLVKELQSRMDMVTEKTKGVARIRVFYEVDATDPGRPYSIGQGSFLNNLISMAGGDNIFGDIRSGYPQVNLEEVVSRDPEFILLGASGGLNNLRRPETVSMRPGWGAINAVLNGRIMEVDANLVTRPGPRIIEGLELIAKTLHPELFLESTQLP